MSMYRSRMPIAYALAALSALSMLSTAAPVGAQQTKCVEEGTYYFHGNDDGIDGVAEDGHLGPEEPQGAVPATQSTLRTPPGSLRALWSGDFHGTVCGQLELTLYVSGATGPHNVQVAEPGGAVLTIQEITFPEGSTPERVTLALPVVGFAVPVAETLRFRFTPRNQATTATFLYGHEDYPAHFTVSTRVPCEEGDPHPECQ